MSQTVTIESLHQELIDLKSILSKVFTATKETLDFSETAVYINQSHSHLYKLTSQGLIPHYKPNGKKIYFKRSELDEWVLQNKVYSADELEEKAVNHVVQQGTGLLNSKGSRK
jgi:excisionase family DNA binding protein